MWYKLQELCVLWDSADSTGSRGTTALLLQGPTHTFWSILADLLLIYIYLQIILRGKTWQNHSQQKTLWPKPDCESKRGLVPGKKKSLSKGKDLLGRRQQLCKTMSDLRLASWTNSFLRRWNHITMTITLPIVYVCETLEVIWWKFPTVWLRKFESVRQWE